MATIHEARLRAPDTRNLARELVQLCERHDLVDAMADLGLAMDVIRERWATMRREQILLSRRKATR